MQNGKYANPSRKKKIEIIFIGLRHVKFHT